jgi:hypothetical protein
MSKKSKSAKSAVQTNITLPMNISLQMLALPILRSHMVNIWVVVFAGA